MMKRKEIYYILFSITKVLYLSYFTNLENIVSNFPYRSKLIELKTRKQFFNCYC